MEQFVFFCVKVSVAAVKIESSTLGGDDELFSSLPVALASDDEDVDLDSQTERKLSSPLTFGRRN